MSRDLGTAGVWLIIAAMAVVTYAMRAGGFLLMGSVPMTARVRAFLQALPGAVVVALVVPVAVSRRHRGDRRCARRACDDGVVAKRPDRRHLRRRRCGLGSRRYDVTCRMSLQNRITPFGEFIATSVRGTMMGNRGGRLHDDERKLTARRWTSKQWICCKLEFNDRHRTLWGDSYTELFFLDEVTALAAGHRPCFECRRKDAERFANLFGDGTRASAGEMDKALHAERLEGKAKRVHSRSIEDLPDGAMIARDGAAFAVRDDVLLRWTPGGYAGRLPRPRGDHVGVLTPPSTLAVLARGYGPQWHPSAET
jgi:Branched-chain amino acid transport protein (AzlD)